MPNKILLVVGARPNFMKIAPIVRALSIHAPSLAPLLVHTGQHYDEAMNDRFFQQLRIPRPDINLEVGSGAHAVQTAEVMKRFDEVLDREEGRDARAVVVVGDINSTIACALVASKRGLPVVHVEAGLRSNDRNMPEEINRILTDQLSDILFTTERSARDNLVREGIADERIHFVGNVMIDTLLEFRKLATPAAEVLAPLGIAGSAYGLVTLHRPSNVDDPAVLRRLLDSLSEIAASLPLVFPVHPRTRSRIEALGAGALGADVKLVSPLGYLEMLGLMAEARLVLTDSGGIQEETTALGVPCLTLRENTERPITVEQGTNTIVGTDGDAIRRAASDTLANGGRRGRIPELWDGQSAVRIATVLQQRFG